MSEEKGKVIELFARTPVGSADRLKEDHINDLVTLAMSGNGVESLKALEQLIVMPDYDPSVRLLEVLFSARTVDLRKRAALHLRDYGTKEVVEGLRVCVMKSWCPASALEAARSIVSLYKKGVSETRPVVLMLVIHAPDKAVRLEVLTAMLVKIDPIALVVAAYALGDSSEKVRSVARSWLLSCEHPGVEKVLLTLRQKKRDDPALRRAITEIMRKRWPDIKKDPDE
jgi:hypothetical protein